MLSNPLATKQVTTNPDLPRTESWGSDRVGDELLIHIKGQDKPLHVMLTEHLVLGRTDKALTGTPDIDLSLYGAFEHGVSRMHAMLQRNGNGIVLIDMGSSNGSYLNGQQLARHVAHVLHDGDEIKLAGLILWIYFGK